MNSMSVFHDSWAGFADMGSTTTKLSIIPVFINGVLTPQVYFCNATLQANQQQNSTGGQIYSNNGAITMIATGTDASITNSGYISANNRVNIISQGSFTNNGGTINSANGDIDINAQSVLITNQSQTNAVTEKENNIFSLLFGGNSGATTKQVGTSTQIQNVSKLTANNINITSTGNLNIQSAYLHALNKVSLTSTNGSVNLTQNSSTTNADHSKDITNYSSQTVANVVETGSTGNSSNTNNSNNNTALLIQKQQNNQQLTQLKIQASGGKDVQSQIDDLNNSNTQISQQLQANANQGSITINSAQDVNILASQNITNNHSSYNETNMMYQIQDNHDLQIQTTVSPLLSSNNITISADNNINLLSTILTGENNLNLTSTNGSVNMQSLQDLYYQYDFSQATSMNLGALIGMLLAAVVIGAVTGGVGTAILGAAGMSAAVASAGMMAAVTSAALTAAGGALVGVGLQMGISAAITADQGGIGATKDMMSGSMNSTTKQYQKTVGNSLLFGGNVNTHSSSGGNSIDTATSISSSNLSQTADNNESAFYESKHEAIGPDWNQLMTDAAINGIAAGTTVVASDFLTAYTGFKPTGALGENNAVWKPDAKLAATDDFKAAFPNYKGVIDPKVNNIGMANEAGLGELWKVGKVVSPADITSLKYEGSWFSSAANKIPGINSMSLFHDTWATTWNMNKFWTVATIAPSIPFEYLALGGNYITGGSIGVENGTNK